METTWTRPADVPLPTVWRTVVGRRPLADGEVPTFLIQDVPPELDGAVIDFMTEHFLRDGPLYQPTGMLQDATSVREIRGRWARALSRRAALVALVEQPSGEAPRIAGANITLPITLADKHRVEEFEGVAMRKAQTALRGLEALVQPDVFSRYGVSCYLSALGLAVDPKFRGNGLGQHLLEARWNLCRALKLPVTATVFNAAASQVLAERVGFETLAELRYDAVNIPEYANCSTPSLKFMAARID